MNDLAGNMVTLPLLQVLVMATVASVAWRTYTSPDGVSVPDGKDLAAATDLFTWLTLPPRPDTDSDVE